MANSGNTIYGVDVIAWPDLLSQWHCRSRTVIACQITKQVSIYNMNKMSTKIYDGITRPQWVNTLRLRQNCHHSPNNIFKWMFMNENCWFSIKISLKFVPKGPINNIPALVQLMAWCRPGNRPLSETMMVNLLMHIWVSQPQWVKQSCNDIQHVNWLPLLALLSPYPTTTLVMYLGGSKWNLLGILPPNQLVTWIIDRVPV